MFKQFRYASSCPFLKCNDIDLDDSYSFVPIVQPLCAPLCGAFVEFSCLPKADLFRKRITVWEVIKSRFTQVVLHSNKKNTLIFVRESIAIFFMAIKERYSSPYVKWIDVTEPTRTEIEQLSQEYHLNLYMVLDCMQPEHLPKYEFDEDNGVHFLILRYYAQGDSKHVSSIQELTNKIAIFASDEKVVTIHKTETPFLYIVAKRAAKHGFDMPELVSKIIWEALETFDEPANRLSEQLDFQESQIMLRQTTGDATEALYYIKREASIAHKVLMLMLEPINHIQPKPGKEALLQDVKDQHLKIQTLYNQVLEDVNNLLGISMSFAAQRTSEVMRILTLFSVFFMPLTFIVGIYGMNFQFMPELREKWGYPSVLILMTVVTVIIFLWFRRKKWL